MEAWRRVRGLPIIVQIVGVAFVALLGVAAVGFFGGAEDDGGGTDPRAPCGPSQLTGTATTDKSRYGPSQTVIITTSVRNSSSRPCQYASSTVDFTIKTASGEPLGGGAGHGDAFSAQPLAPGEALTQQHSWDQRDCRAGGGRCSQAAPGRYVIDVLWRLGGDPIDATGSFELVG